jgi:hypothetical protein
MSWLNILKVKRIRDSVKKRIDNIMSDGKTRSTHAIIDALENDGGLKRNLPSKPLIGRYLKVDNRYMVIDERRVNTKILREYKLR